MDVPVVGIYAWQLLPLFFFPRSIFAPRVSFPAERGQLENYSARRIIFDSDKAARRYDDVNDSRIILR